MSDRHPIDPSANENVALGISLGHHRAFGWMAAKCSAVDAHALKDLRDNQRYLRTGLNWEAFCQRHTGICSRTADRIITRLHEFGDTYFNLSQLLPVTTNEYRELLPNIDNGTLEFDGREIPITPDNVDLLRAAVANLRAKMAKARAAARRDPLDSLAESLDRCLGQLAGAIRRKDTDPDRLRALLADLARRAAELTKEF